MTPRANREAAGVVEMRVGLPEPPPPALDPYLDAAVRCFVRYGVHRTSVQDVAAEMKVNRTTVYRQVGNVDAMLRLVNARAVHRIVEEAFRRADPASVSAHTVVQLLADLIEMVRSDPVVGKVLGDELDLVGTLVADLPAMIERVVAAVTPGLEAAMRSGRLARGDARSLAEWMTRIGGSCILAPPPGDLRAFLAEVLVPVLTPAGLGSVPAN
ncbi:MAG TPA: TetR/AcrR family transcriptional regulator [Acidimicrobiales bacterium]|nr:TetR/AcrR family transcriptional regulator [Acidimicrobiales bacterium]